jgi:predicted RNA binding protein YcfA (HicA-like mRNA interferase family)
MVRLWNIKYRQISQKLKKLWYIFYREWKWSHELWINKALNRVIPLPKHSSKDFKIWTLRAIIRELGITVEEFLNL